MWIKQWKHILSTHFIIRLAHEFILFIFIFQTKYYSSFFKSYNQVKCNNPCRTNYIILIRSWKYFYPGRLVCFHVMCKKRRMVLVYVWNHKSFELRRLDICNLILMIQIPKEHLGTNNVITSYLQISKNQFLEVSRISFSKHIRQNHMRTITYL